jgi:hypothetical protein
MSLYSTFPRNKAVGFTTRGGSGVDRALPHLRRMDALARDLTAVWKRRVQTLVATREALNLELAWQYPPQGTRAAPDDEETASSPRERGTILATQGRALAVLRHATRALLFI